MLNGKRILVAPLDWGLGHATRCVPIVQALQARGAHVVLGADGGPLELLRGEFPDLEHVRIPGAHIRYSRSRSQLWSMLRQFPAMLRSVQAEQALFDRLRGELKLDGVVSDQRFGVRSPDLPSVLITHQVFPFTPIAQPALRKLNLRHIARFHRCWVMDEPMAPGLSGELAHHDELPANARFIGTVSRFSSTGPPPERQWDIVAVVSGPEPQRSLFEDALEQQLAAIPGRHLLVRGRPGTARAGDRGGVQRVPHLPARELESAMKSARLIVSRTGYTTLMDLATIGRTALLVPTPGQAEQEYLGHLHRGTGRFLVQDQHELDVVGAWERLRDQASGEAKADGHPMLEEALNDLEELLGL